MATNAAAVAIAMMNCGGGGGSGGDVTKQYVDDHLALKADKTETAEYPIADTTTGINPSITDSADANVQGLTVYGRSEVVEGEIVSIGDDGSLTITTANSDSTKTSTATLTTGLPLCGIPVNSGETYTDEGGVKWLADEMSVEGVTKRCYKITLDGSEPSSSYAVISGSTTLPSGSKLISVTTSTRHSSSQRALSDGSLSNVSTNWSSNDDSYSLSRDDLFQIRFRVAGISTTDGLRAYFASNPITIIYERAEPTTTLLTNEEQQALLALRTYDGTTNLSITDDPYVDFSYLKNTQNGKAIAENNDNLKGLLGWIANVPEMHRNIFRGKSLGSSVTAAQLAAIADGSFDDLYVSDYWTTEFTYDGNTFTVNWRIADIDYYINRGNPALTAHHLLIMPDCTLTNAQLNSYAANAYYNSDMYGTVIPALLTAIQSQFTDKILTFYDVYGTSTSDMQNRARQLEIPTSFMCLGSTLMSDPENAISIRTNFFDRLALFNLCPEYAAYKAYTGATGNVDSYWTRTNGTNAQEWAVIGTRAGQAAATDTFGVRPYFLLGDAT